VDVKETDASYIITADIPGLSKKEVNLNISNDVLSISGERIHDTEQDSDRYHYRERSRGTFVRSFNIPESVNEKKITANFKDGILSVKLPKAEIVEPKAREIKIS
jgi:HSP20 family protein